MLGSERLIFGLICLHLLMGCTSGNEMCKPSIGGRRGACPPSWTKWGDRCYQAIGDRVDWYGAKQECNRMGSVLFMPQSLEESEFLAGLFEDSVWINCNDVEKEDTWKCLYGPEETEYKNWYTDQPDNHQSTENCVEVKVTTDAFGQWNDEECDQLNYALCIHPAPQLHF